MAFEISNSYFQEFQMVFHDMLHQHGSQLLPWVKSVPVTGETQSLRFFNMGEATIGELGASGLTEYSPVLYDRRVLRPVPIRQAILMNEFEMRRQGMPPVNELAQRLSEGCGIALDTVILNGIGGTARTASGGDIPLPTSQIICYDTEIYGNVDNQGNARTGLTAMKISYAIATLRHKFVEPEIICIASNKALGQLQIDERAASSLYNRVQTQSEGIMTPFAGVSAFVPSERIPMPTKIHSTSGGAVVTADSAAATEVANADKKYEYAYVVARNYITLGSSKEFELQSAQDPSRNMDLMFYCSGMYDCIREQEEAVIAIELDVTANN